jgi:hypothetical protein
MPEGVGAIRCYTSGLLTICVVNCLAGWSHSGFFYYLVFKRPAEFLLIDGGVPHYGSNLQQQGEGGPDCSGV